MVRIDYAGDTTASIFFFYNDDGDIEKIYNGTDTSIYHYASDSIVMDWIDGIGKTVATQRFTTQSEGRVISNRVMDPSGALFSISTYVYRPDGKLNLHTRKNMRTNDTFEMQYAYVGKNIAYVDILRNGEKYDRFSYAYDTTSVNRFQFDLDNLTNDFMARGRLGEVNTHLIRNAYRITPEGDTTGVRLMTYEFDADGYVLSRTDTDGQHGYSNTRHFIYQ